MHPREQDPWVQGAGPNQELCLCWQAVVHTAAAFSPALCHQKLSSSSEAGEEGGTYPSAHSLLGPHGLWHQSCRSACRGAWLCNPNRSPGLCDTRTCPHREQSVIPMGKNTVSQQYMSHSEGPFCRCGVFYLYKPCPNDFKISVLKGDSTSDAVKGRNDCNKTLSGLLMGRTPCHDGSPEAHGLKCYLIRARDPALGGEGWGMGYRLPSLTVSTWSRQSFHCVSL